MDRYMPDGWILPAIDERNRPFFTSGRLLLQACADCGKVQHPPEDVCRTCQSMNFGYQESGGTGTIFSYTVVHHPVHQLLHERVPYIVALVQLDDFPHVRIVGNIVDAAPGAVGIGAAVAALWEEITDPATGELIKLPQWGLS